MNTGALRDTPRCQAQRKRGVFVFALTMLLSAGWLVVVAADKTEKRANNGDYVTDDSVVSLAAYNVKADRIEDFGFRVGDPNITFVAVVPRPEAPYIEAILPNTAASKAGLQPGDRILKSDGRSASMTIFSTGKWKKFLAAKNAEAASGKTVKWTLEVRPPGAKESRIVTLILPTPPPRWGSSVWRTPEGRKPGTVTESGPLAERCLDILDNGIWARADLLAPPDSGRSVGDWPTTGYQWAIGSAADGGKHLMTVTQTNGRAEVILETWSRATSRWVYRTSPSGALEKAWHFTRKKKGEVSLEEARLGFEHELDLWTTKVGKVSPRWPLELKPGYDANAIFAVLAAKDGITAAPPPRPFAEEFLKLPAANETQRTLFADAFGKLGAEPDCWAYTETSRGLENKRVTVTRVDPSKPEADQCVLLSIDGKPPKPDDVHRWRDEGGDTPKALGDIPPLASIVDLKDTRIHTEDTASVVFELPIRSDSAEFPAEKFQATFRVNKASRAFEEIAIKLRENFRVAGVVKVIEAGLQARFQTIDPAHPPQPVLLKGGGAVRFVLVKIGRDFETTRTDFKRVIPLDEAVTPVR